MKYIKVMYGLTAGANSNFHYKLNDVTYAKTWNPNAKNGKEFGGINFSTPEKILRWLHRGDTLYDVTIPDDAEVIDVVESATPHGVFRTNKIIISNPRKIDDEMALQFYKISTIPDEAYYDALGVVSIMNYKKTALAILNDKVNKNNINEVLTSWNDFIYKKPERINCNETVILIEKMIKEIKSNEQ